MSNNINIKRGILLGNSLSPLLSCISLIPLSFHSHHSLTNSSRYGYKFGAEQITHLFYTGHLKLYGKDDSKRERFLRIVKGFTDDIGMEIGFGKCTKGVFKRGKLEKSDRKVQLDEKTMIWSQKRFGSILVLMNLVECNTPQ